jgi:hypothetical protein
MGESETISDDSHPDRRDFLVAAATTITATRLATTPATAPGSKTVPNTSFEPPDAVGARQRGRAYAVLAPTNTKVSTDTIVQLDDRDARERFAPRRVKLHPAHGMSGAATSSGRSPL